MLRRSLSPLVTLFGLGSYCALTVLFPVFSNIGDTMLMELSGGYLLFGFVFLAADPQTMPKTAFGKIILGFVIGIVGNYIDGARFFLQKDRWGKDLLVFEIEANAFLWKMVRTLTGTLVNLDKTNASEDE